MKLQDQLSAIERFTAPMPKFFERIFDVLSIVSVICAAIVMMAGSLTEVGVVLPEKWALIVSVASAIGAFVAKFTVDFDKYNPPKPRDEL